MASPQTVLYLGMLFLSLGLIPFPGIAYIPLDRFLSLGLLTFPWTSSFLWYLLTFPWTDFAYYGRTMSAPGTSAALSWRPSCTPS